MLAEEVGHSHVAHRGNCTQGKSCKLRNQRQTGPLLHLEGAKER